VLEIVEADFGVSREQLLHPSRCDARISHARQVAMYLCYIVLGRSLSGVGRIFGRDRTTVAYAGARIEDLRDDAAFDARLTRLESEITEAENMAKHRADRRAAG
jgi:chromosomal replication initiation ATPase DnaA